MHALCVLYSKERGGGEGGACASASGNVWVAIGRAMNGFTIAARQSCAVYVNLHNPFIRIGVTQVSYVRVSQCHTPCFE